MFPSLEILSQNLPCYLPRRASLTKKQVGLSSQPKPVTDSVEARLGATAFIVSSASISLTFRIFRPQPGTSPSTMTPLRSESQ